MSFSYANAWLTVFVMVLGVVLQICQWHTEEMEQRGSNRQISESHTPIHPYAKPPTNMHVGCLFYLWLLRVKLHSKAFKWKHTQKDFLSQDLANFCCSTHTKSNKYRRRKYE